MLVTSPGKMSPTGRQPHPPKGWDPVQVAPRSSCTKRKRNSLHNSRWRCNSQVTNLQNWQQQILPGTWLPLELVLGGTLSNEWFVQAVILGFFYIGMIQSHTQAIQNWGLAASLCLERGNRIVGTCGHNCLDWNFRDGIVIATGNGQNWEGNGREG